MCIRDRKPSVKGVVIKNLSKITSNWRNEESIIDYLKRNNILMIFGIDTRKLTRHLRDKGAMNYAISNTCLEVDSLMKDLKKIPSMKGMNLVDTVTTIKTYSVTSKKGQDWHNWKTEYQSTKDIGKNLLILVIDFGVKNSIVECLLRYSCKVIVLPSNVSIEKIKHLNPDGILLSNGPGDPSTVIYANSLINSLLELNIPLFGICMGHQLLSIALGCETFKLKFGHRGLNHPCGYGQYSYITSQNHGFAVALDSIQATTSVDSSHINLNDNTIAGLSTRKQPVFSVQYHPEAGPGPHDNEYLFNSFINIVRNNKIEKYQTA